MREIRGNQVKSDTINGSDINDGFGFYDETNNYSIGDFVIWNAGRYKANTNITGGAEGDYSASPDISGDWDIAGYFPKPIISNILPIATFNHAITSDITIKGSYITETVDVTIVSQTVNSVTYVDAHTCIINVTSNSTDGLYDVTITTDEGGSNTYIDGFKVKLSVWLDLRLGGNTFTDGNGAGNDIRYKDTMSMTRDVNGMYFSGEDPRASWVKFESESWTRGSNKTIKWVITAPVGAMMVGIFSDATDEASTSQYRQAEVEAYFSNSTTQRGLYGNNGTVGTAGNESHTVTISSSGVYRLEFTNDGTTGSSIYSIYELPSANQADWDNTSNLLDTWAIGGTLAPDEANIMPGCIPRNNDAQRFVALLIE